MKWDIVVDQEPLNVHKSYVENKAVLYVTLHKSGLYGKYVLNKCNISPSEILFLDVFSAVHFDFQHNDSNIYVVGNELAYHLFSILEIIAKSKHYETVIFDGIDYAKHLFNQQIEIETLKGLLHNYFEHANLIIH